MENQNNNNRTVKQWQKQRRVRERTVQQHRRTESSRQKGFPLPQWYYYYSVIWKAQFLSVPTYNKIVDILYKQSEYESILITESLWQGNIFTDKWADSKFKSNLTLFPHLLPPSLPLTTCSGPQVLFHTLLISLEQNIIASLFLNVGGQLWNWILIHTCDLATWI